MHEPGNEELRAELERVRKERDEYKSMLRDLIKRQFDIDVDELEVELREWQQKGGGMPFSKIWEVLETEFGIKP
jgi:hypothetical protein